MRIAGRRIPIADYLGAAAGAADFLSANRHKYRRACPEANEQ
jgi:hypothetical protein